MRIRTLIILTLSASIASVLALTAINMAAGWKLASLSRAQNWTHTATHEINNLLILTHEYALHAEPRAATQWRQSLETLLLHLQAGEDDNTGAIEKAQLLAELFTQLAAGNQGHDRQFEKERRELLLDQLLSNTQALSDRFNEASLKLNSKLDQIEKTVKLTAIFLPLVSIAALLILASLLARRVLRPLGTMRNAVDAVSRGDLGVRSNTGTGDEFGELSRAFDTMALDLVSQLQQEIGERRKIEEDLQKVVEERSASLKAIIGNAIDGIITTDEAGIILSVNRATEKLFGYDASQMLGHNIAMLMPQPDRQMHPQHMQQYKQTGMSNIIGKGRELVAQHRDGHLFPIHLSISEFKLGRDTRFTGIVRDISAQKQNERALIAARDEAERANEAKSTFLSSMSHELRTPMNAIIGFSQLMILDQSLTARHRNSAEEIYNAAQHLLLLINEVLDLARIETGNIELSPESVELCPVIEECMALLNVLAEKYEVSISHGHLHGVCVHADRGRLKQVLLNLLSNAVKYNRPGGSVHLDIKQLSAERLQIQISDTGNGLSPAQMENLFQPFNRLGMENTGIEGTGIGLTLSKRIVDMMDGMIGVRSEAGVGSTFWIELPVDKAPDLHKQESVPENLSPAALKDKHLVLYIEDNPSNLRLMAEIISKREHIHLLTAHTPLLGIELANIRRPELILLDINMYGMDGYKVLEIIRADENLKHIPVVAVTANAMAADIKRGLEAGFDDYLTKPVDIARLYAILDCYLHDRPGTPA